MSLKLVLLSSCFTTVLYMYIEYKLLYRVELEALL